MQIDDECDVAILPVAKRFKIFEASNDNEIHIIPYICTISIDCLAPIIEFVDTAFMIEKLYSCGSRQLNQMMQNGGVTKLVYNVNSSYFKRLFLVYERYAKNLHTLVSNFSSSQIKSFCSLLSCMTRLERLKLTCRSLNDLVIPLFPKTLTWLSLSQTKATHECIVDLPRSLTYLYVDFDLKDGIRHLPPELLHLESRSTCLSKHHLALLPRSILCLHITVNKDWNPQDLNDLASSCNDLDLPPNLTTLVLVGSDYKVNPPVHKLPLLLKTLRLSGAGLFGDFSFLPATLTSFETHYSNDGTISSSKIAQLPLELRHLDIPYLPMDHSVFGKFTFLQSLNILQWTGLDEEIASLPRSLTRLCFTRESHLNNAGVANLPPKLTSLDMGGKNLTDKGVALLPSGLTKLYLFLKGRRTNKALENLPRSLTKLRMDWNNSTMTSEEGFALLPRGLTSLDFRIHQRKDDLIFRTTDLQHLPSTLTELPNCMTLQRSWKTWKNAQ